MVGSCEHDGEIQGFREFDHLTNHEILKQLLSMELVNLVIVQHPKEM